MLWIAINKVLTKMDENLVLGVVYIPPESSNYYNEDKFLTLGNEILSVSNINLCC